MRKVCGNCRFFDGDDGCHRRAPIPSPQMFYGMCLALSFMVKNVDVSNEVGSMVGSGGGHAEWPVVHPETDWCGEWEKIEDA